LTEIFPDDGTVYLTRPDRLRVSGNPSGYQRTAGYPQAEEELPETPPAEEELPNNNPDRLHILQ
jgi:hypothetical protein